MRIVSTPMQLQRDRSVTITNQRRERRPRGFMTGARRRAGWAAGAPTAGLDRHCAVLAMSAPGQGEVSRACIESLAESRETVKAGLMGAFDS